MSATDEEGVGVPTPLQTFYLTFGVRYRHEKHPAWDGAHPDGWLEIQAPDEEAARLLVRSFIGNKYAFIYDEHRFERKWHPRGRLATITTDGGIFPAEGVGAPTPRYGPSDPEYYGVDGTDVVAVRVEGELKGDYPNPEANDVELFHPACVEAEDPEEMFLAVFNRDDHVLAYELDWANPAECPICNTSIT